MAAGFLRENKKIIKLSHSLSSHYTKRKRSASYRNVMEMLHIVEHKRTDLNVGLNPLGFFTGIKVLLRHTEKVL